MYSKYSLRFKYYNNARMVFINMYGAKEESVDLVISSWTFFRIKRTIEKWFQIYIILINEY